MRQIVTLIAWLLVSAAAHTQSCPPNLDFESGNFSNWDCFVGFTQENMGQNEILLNPSPPAGVRHQIISATSPVQMDPYGKFPTLCPYGGNYSVKLGNDGTGREAEGISYTFQVPTTVDTFTFTYFYAVVFQDPEHPSQQQPRFFVTAYDVVTGNVINCASYNYIASGSIPGFQETSPGSDLWFKPWTPTSLQFAGLGGRTVRLEFKTADCTLGGHFGYAYLDVASACSNILATAPYCIETNSLILNAPYGFQSYTWYKNGFSQVVGNGQSITFSPPPDTSGVFYVDMIPYPGYGCRDTLQARATPLPVPDTPRGPIEIYYCQYSTSLPIAATASPGNTLLWYTAATGGNGSDNTPRPSTATIGSTDYWVSQKALYGCEGPRKKLMVFIVPTPIADLTVNRFRQCQNGNDFAFKSTSRSAINATYTWTFGDGATLTTTVDSVIHHTYLVAGTFPVTLKVQNAAGGCTSQMQHYVSVIPKPVAVFSHPPVICEQQTPLTFTDASYVPNGTAAINSWWWNMNGLIVTAQSPASATANIPGDLPVQLVVKTSEGCVSDTVSKIVKVRYRPTAAFSVSDLLCENEVLRFSDKSFIAGGIAEERVTRWAWDFGAGIAPTVQDPAMNLTAGHHTVKLVAESNFGCKSLPVSTSLMVHPKPRFNLTVSDSCVFRNLVYNATDLTGDVQRWWWDFGGGFTANSNTLTKTFRTEGSYPFTLMPQTVWGCKDTLYRPFTVYDNDAFAGRDTVAAWDEPVQLNARGGSNVQYIWTPSVGLNNQAIEVPVAVLDYDQRYTMYAITDKGCDATSSILIKRYKGPELYVPTGFTPNNDGKNDVLKVVPIGMKAFHYLAVYNRYGELIFRTTDYNKGWDGTHRGVKQSSDAFVVVAEAIDYRGKKVLYKGTVMLIR